MSSESVIRALESALQGAPRDVPLRLHLAQLLEQEGQFEKAREHYSILLTIAPSHREA